MGHVKLQGIHILPDRENIELLCRNMDLLFRHAEFIMENADWYCIHVEGFTARGNFVGPLELQLGEVLLLWLCDTPWLHVRPDGDRVFVYGVMGSIISDYNFVYGWSERLQELVSFRPGVHFTKFFFPAKSLVTGKQVAPGSTPLSDLGFVAGKPPQRYTSDKTIAELIITLNEREGRTAN